MMKFERAIAEAFAQLRSVFEDISRMRCHDRINEVDGSKVVVDDLMGYLHYCATGIMQNIVVPKPGIYADSIIGSQDFTGGNNPKKIGKKKNIRIVTIEGFPSASVPGIFRGTEYASDFVPLVLSVHFFLEAQEGRNISDRLRKRWKQKKCVASKTR
ncbi:hypothetical protein ACFS07_35940 [Undibacterium arcticum]